MMNRRSILLAILVLAIQSLCGQASRSGDYYATIEQIADAKRWPETNLWKATIHHRERGKLYEISKEVPYDVQYPALYLSGVDGRSVILQPFDGRIEFYDTLGSRVAALSPFVEESPDYERIIKCSLARDRAVFLTSSPTERGVSLVMTDMNGEQKWRIRLAHTTAGEVHVSENGRCILAGSYTSDDQLIRSTVLLDNSGKILRTLPQLFRYADFDADGSRFVISGRNSVTIGSITGTEGVSTWSTRSREEIVTAVRWTRNHVAVVVETVDISTGKPAYHAPSLVLLNEHAGAVLKKQIDSKSDAPATLEVSDDLVTLSSGNRHLRVTLEDVE